MRRAALAVVTYPARARSSSAAFASSGVSRRASSTPSAWLIVYWSPRRLFGVVSVGAGRCWSRLTTPPTPSQRASTARSTAAGVALPSADVRARGVPDRQRPRRDRPTGRRPARRRCSPARPCQRAAGGGSRHGCLHARRIPAARHRAGRHPSGDRQRGTLSMAPPVIATHPLNRSLRSQEDPSLNGR